MITKYERSVFINSEINTRQGQIQTLQFPSGSFAVGPNERMELVLDTFSCRKNWYSINSTNNIYYVYDPAGPTYTECVIPAGNYMSFDTPGNVGPPAIGASLCEGIVSSLVNAGFGGTCTYDPLKRKLTITPTGFAPGAYIVCFQVSSGAGRPVGVSEQGYFSDVCEVFGAKDTREGWVGNPPQNAFETATTTPVGNVAYITPFVAQLNTLESIYVLCDLHSGNFQTNGFSQGLPSNQDTIRPTNIFARINLKRAFFDPLNEFIDFQDSNNNFAMFLHQNQISNVTFRITDDKGRLIPEVEPGQAQEGSLSFKMSVKWRSVADDFPPGDRKLTPSDIVPKYQNLTLV